jgi:hypothetical protein
MTGDECGAAADRYRCVRDHFFVLRRLRGRSRRMSVLYVLVMVAVIVAVDLLFFRDKTWFWERLAANIGVVLVAGAFYFRFPGSS